MGRKKIPFYRIVAIDSRKRRDGLYIEKIGHYNPLPAAPEVVIDKELAMKWLDRGAIPSDTVRGLLQRKGILLEWDLKRLGAQPEKIEQEFKKWEALQLEREKRREAMAVMEKREKAKDRPKEEPKVEAKAEPKEEPKVEVKAESREELKVEAKAELKEEPAPAAVVEESAPAAPAE
jgi:small subunit ribosomal protein S16